MNPLAATLKLLANNNNDCATAVLIAALDASQRDIRDLALAALLDRGGPAAELHILRQWPNLSERWRQQVADRTDWLSASIRGAIVNRDPTLFVTACSAAVATRNYEAIPHLAVVAADAISPFAARAATTALELTDLFNEELNSPRDYRVRRDPQLLRAHVLVALERVMDRLDGPYAREMLEAFLLLASRDNAAISRLLQFPAEVGHSLLVNVLATCSRPAIEKLLLSYLDDPRAPHAAINIIGRRADISFLRHLGRKLADGPTPDQSANLWRIQTIGFLPDHLDLIDALRDAEQPGIVHLVVESSISRDQVFVVLNYILRQGNVSARRLAARALSQFSGPAADALALQTLEDDDSQVRAAAASQLRERNVPGAIDRLVDILGSPHIEERQAAQAGLREFTLNHFSAVFDSLTPAARIASGALVRRVDSRAIDQLQADMTSLNRGRKQRAIEMALALNAVDVLQVPLALLLKDEDQYLRIEAIRALATLDCRLTREALRDALLDSHPLVQQAAENALTQLNRSNNDLPAKSTLAFPEAAPPRDASGLGLAIPAPPERSTTALTEVMS
jgi:HEAT repeat protein